MNKISEALAKRFEELGGKIVLNAPIDRVYRDGDTIRGFETKDGYLWTADEYVANIDINRLAPDLGHPPMKDREIACSGVTVFLGLSKRVTGLAHHNFFFSKSHRDEFRDIYERGIPHKDPTVYVCVPTITDSSVAPAGKENIFLLIHSSIDNGKTDWDVYLPEYIHLVERKLAKMGFDVEHYGVELRKGRSPRGIGERWGTYKGNIYGEASHGKLSGGFKTSNHSSQFRNLHFAGGTVNPGAGVPMSIMSGMIAGSSLIQKKLSLTELRL